MTNKELRELLKKYPDDAVFLNLDIYLTHKNAYEHHRLWRFTDNKVEELTKNDN